MPGNGGRPVTAAATRRPGPAGTLRRTWWLAAVALLAACSGPATPAATAPGGQLGHAGRWFTDAAGRVVVLHGVNMVYKLPPYYPAAAGFGASDAAFLARNGLTVVRVGVIWAALEPRPGVFDDAYLARIAQTVRMLGRHGIVSILDFHQDQMNGRFAGEGFPDWAVLDGGLPNSRTAFPAGYAANPALQRAFDNFWADTAGPGGVGLQERYAAAWRHVAERFRGDPSVLGYELMNEPFPGSGYLRCVGPGGCPGADARLAAFYAKVDRAIRSVDRTTLVLTEPWVTFNFGVQDHLAPLHDPRAVFAWHDYCLGAAPCPSNATDFGNAAADIAGDGEAEFLTEFADGYTTPSGGETVVVPLADRHMVSWTTWAYCTCGDFTGSPHEGMVLDPHAAKTGANVVQRYLRTVVEPYPHIVAGTPDSWGYDRSTRVFHLAYSTRRASGPGRFAAGSVTQVETPAFDYPAGYAAHVTGGAVTSAPRAPVLRIAQCPGARAVTVTVRPGTGSSGTCRPP